MPGGPLVHRILKGVEPGYLRPEPGRPCALPGACLLRIGYWDGALVAGRHQWHPENHADAISATRPSCDQGRQGDLAKLNRAGRVQAV